MSLRVNGADTGLEATRAGDVVTLGGGAEPVGYEVLHVDGPCWILRRDGVQHVAHVARVKDACWIHVDGRTHLVDRAARDAPKGAAGDGALVAPMTGRIVDVAVSLGARVAEGAVIVVLSAMKMRVDVKAPFDGVVATLSVGEGDQVEGGAPLARIEPEAVP